MTHHIVIDHDVLLAGLHLVVVGVPDDDGECGSARHRGVSRVLQHNTAIVYCSCLSSFGTGETKGLKDSVV